MKEKRLLVALGALSSALVACASETGEPGIGDDGGVTPGAGAPNGPGPGPGTGGAGSGTPGTAGGTGVPGAGGPNGTAGVGGPNQPPTTCVPGVPATTQIPRLLNRQYEAVIRDLLGVTGVIADNKTASALLVSDSDGPMTPDAWRIYNEVAAAVARSVMSGPNRSQFISCDPATAGCMRQTIETFGRKAFRRPLTPMEVERFEKLGQTTPSGTPAEVAEATLNAFLVSPSFLLLPELAPEQEGSAIKLSQHEVATRLSFLLWGSIPDDMLNQAADTNQLQTKEQIQAQAQRMAAVREKTGLLMSLFHRDWAQMNNNSSHWWKMDHDPAKYPLYSPAAKPTYQAELDAFFEEVAFTNGTFKDLFLSNVAFVNGDNAAVYGLDPAGYGTALTKVELDAAQRPGFLTRAGFLSSYANFDASSPILRGAFITVYMMGTNVPPPTIDTTQVSIEGQFPTQRAYVEALTNPGDCVGCHSIINPPGFVLENYDAIGKWQTVDPRGGAIDSSVTTATINIGGTPKEISSPAQLMQEIAQTPTGKESYARAWVSYAYGRAPNANDQCVVEQLNTKLSQDGYGILNVLADLTQADSFRLRVRETP